MVVIFLTLNGAGGAAWAAPTEWTAVDNPDGATLEGISCPTVSFCAAVGYSFVGRTTPGSIEMYDGETWSVPSFPRPRNTVLNGVSCVSAAFCMAVGTQAQATRSYKWDGTAWVARPVSHAAGSWNGPSRRCHA